MMDQFIEELEKQRCTLQAKLDSQKTAAERNRLGQFATPTQLSRDVLGYGLSLLPKTTPIRFLDPAIGTGSFYSALRSTSPGRPIKAAKGFEVDAHYGEPARSLWKNTRLDITIADFTRQIPPDLDSEKATLLICNPPYVRHHHIDGIEKARLHFAAHKMANARLSGLSGLYCYFMCLAHSWMSGGGVAAWLIPSEFMDVNYGRILKQYLLREVTLLHIHRFDPNNVQFDDALVSSAIVWFRKERPQPNHKVVFSFGGTMQSPALTSEVGIDDLQRTDKWTKFPKHTSFIEHEGYRLADLFTIKRGLATGDNDFFIMDEAKAAKLNLPRRFLLPVLPSTRYIKNDEILADSDGIPLLDKRLFLIDCDRPEEEVAREHPVLWKYLQTGIERVASRYLCRSRRVWYGQERRPPAPIVCTYMGRSDHERRPFRFLLNNSRATATNVYLMLYPQPILEKQLVLRTDGMRLLWQALNLIERDTLLGSGRVYGGGLHKLEPKELGNVPADSLAALVGLKPKVFQLELLAKEIFTQ